MRDEEIEEVYWGALTGYVVSSGGREGDTTLRIGLITLGAIVGRGGKGGLLGEIP